jgi:nucleotide-binding universal stress UspA family protein
MPVISIVRELGVLYTFPELTEADVYLLLSERRDDLQTALGWHIDLPEAVPELVEETRRRQRPVLARLVGAVAPELDEGPPPGEWRREQMAMHRENHLFADILLIMEGIGQDWDMLERAIEVAVWDEDRILGLRVANERRLTPEGVAETRERFLERCRETGIEAEFAYEEGNPLKIILRRAAWADLMLINLTHPPDSTPLDRLRNIWGPLIQRSPCPILAFPHAVRSTMVNALLPYDGSPQSREALFVATYLAARWQIGLTVVTVTSRHTEAAALEEARTYLTEHGIDWARFVLESGEIGDSILRVADEVESDLLIMGSYGRQPLKRLVLGSVVEQMLREFPHPMLICR